MKAVNMNPVSKQNNKTKHMAETYTIERNGVIKRLDPYSLVKGKKKGAQYLAPTVDFSTPEAWAEEVTWGELKNIANNWQTFLKRVFQDMWFSNVGPDGVANIPKFLEEAKDFTAAGMKLAEINDKLEEAQAELLRLLDSAEVDSEGKISAATKAQMDETSAYIRILKAMKEDRSRKRTQPDAEEAAEPSVRVA